MGHSCASLTAPSISWFITPQITWGFSSVEANWNQLRCLSNKWCPSHTAHRHTNTNNNCIVFSGRISTKIFFTITGLAGLFVCFFGHRFFKCGKLLHVTVSNIQEHKVRILATCHLINCSKWSKALLWRLATESSPHFFQEQSSETN